MFCSIFDIIVDFWPVPGINVIILSYLHIAIFGIVFAENLGQ